MSYISQVIILQCGPPSLHYCTFPKKAFSSSLVWARREYIRPDIFQVETQLKEKYTDLF